MMPITVSLFYDVTNVPSALHHKTAEKECVLVIFELQLRNSVQISRL